MTDYPQVYYKAKAVIQSCQTPEQATVAGRYLMLAKRHMHVDSAHRLNDMLHRKLVAFKYAQACWATRDLIAVV